MPLKVGNKWRYRLEYFEGNKVMPPNISFYTESIDSISSYNNANWFVYSSQDSKSYFRNFDDGLHSLINFENTRIIKYPLEINDSWSYEDKAASVVSQDGLAIDSAKVEISLEVIDILEDVKYNLLPFDKVFILREMINSNIEEFGASSYDHKLLHYVYNIGLIKEEHIINGNIVFQKDLIEYNFIES
jgi:hypothetical protein